MILLKFILLQIFWLAVVLYGKSVDSLLLIVFALFMVGSDYFTFRPQKTFGHYIALILFFLIAGILNDSSLIFFKMIDKNSYVVGNISLWIVFIAYYETFFTKLKNLPMWSMMFLGGAGGSISYWSAARLGAVMIGPGMENHYVLSQFFFWAIFFPLSLKIYFNDKIWDSILDKTIFFSFDRSGYLRHKSKFDEDFREKKFKGKTALVTGATSGIGEEVASFLSRQQIKVSITGRNEKKGADFVGKNADANFISLDMANWKNVFDFAKNSTSFDYVVFNAGSMPETLSVNELGVEFQCASQLLGHYYLLTWLKEFNKLKPGARIVWVSSGGMYLKKLDLASLFQNSDYDKVETYANVKRAQVTLVEELAKIEEWNNISIFSMHPGWVGTSGLKEALPKFYRFMEKRLRTAYEGADTIIWCLLSDQSLNSGGFYFDRKKVSAYLSDRYYPSLGEREQLMSSIDNIKKKILI